MIKIILLTFIILFTSCSMFKGKDTAKKNLTVNKDATIILGDEEKEIKKDVGADLPTESFLIKAKGNIPVYVIPLSSSFQEVKINLNEFEASQLTSTFKNSINTTLSESLFDIHDIQNEIFRKQYNRALVLIDAAEKKYGELSFLTYTKASVYYLRGNKAQAKQLLKSVKEEGKSKQKIESFLNEIE